MNHLYEYLRDDHNINFKMVSAQHFLNEAPCLFIFTLNTPNNEFQLVRVNVL